MTADLVKIHAPSTDNTAYQDDEIDLGELFATLIVLYLVPVTYSLYWSAGGRLAASESESDESLAVERDFKPVVA